jgi:hypothetical protein
VSYDLFGTGKTALKASLSRYRLSDTVTFARALNPLNTTVNSATRSWTDRNGDFIPQVDELGPLNPRNFGQRIVSTRYDPDVVTGFGKRQRNWEVSTGIQHEVMPRVSAEVAYFRRSDGNLTLTDIPVAVAGRLRSVLHHGADRPAPRPRQRFTDLRAL